jgi:transcriptional regulator with XRE-family HTH domain
LKRSSSARVAEVIQSHIAASRTRMSYADRAAKLGISPSALYAWINGVRIPKPESLRDLAAHLYPNDEAAQDNFLAEAQKAIEEDRSKGTAEALPGAIRAGVIEYGAFSSLDDNHPGFVVSFFKRFTAYAGREIASPPIPDRSLSASDSPLLSDRVDVTLGLLATVDRMTLFDFVITPARITLNAIAPFGASLDDLRQALKIDSVAHNRRQFVPVIHPKEVGGLYVDLTLKVGQGERVPISLFDPAEYAKSFREQLVADRHKRPVIVADELTCMRILKDHLRGEATLVYELGGCANHGALSGSTFPLYPVGLAVNRTHTKWSQYLLRAIDLYLRTDPANVAALYFDLFLALKDQARDMLVAGATTPSAPRDIDERATNWAKRTLGLCGDDAFVVAPEWRAVLDLTAKKIELSAESQPSEGKPPDINALRDDIKILTAKLADFSRYLDSLENRSKEKLS